MAGLARGVGAVIVGREYDTVLYEIGLVAEADPRPAGCQEGQTRQASAA